MGICTSTTDNSNLTKKNLKETAHEFKEEAKAEVNKEVSNAKDIVEAEVGKGKSELIEKAEGKIREGEKKIKTAYANLTKGMDKKVINFINSNPPEINYSAKRIKKYFKDQKEYTGKSKFTDDFFPPIFGSIIGQDKEGRYFDKDDNRRVEAESSFKINQDEVIWLRPEEIFEGEFALFEGKIEFDDVRQGSIGNCYFMASISALTECPQIIAEIFRQHEVQKSGYYEICLRIDGEWNVVVVDDYFPCTKLGRKPIFARPKGHEIWSMLLEKAWAKINGGYVNTVAGMASEVIECLTNFPYEYNQTVHALNSDEAKEELWNKILEASQNEYIMTTALPPREGAEKIGLVAGHEYTLQKGIEFIDNNKKIRLVRIRNPWGSMNYKGKWGKNDSSWTDKLKEAFDYKGTYDDDGEFFMEYDSFVNFFADVDICKIEDRIVLKQEKIRLGDKKGPRVYEIHVHEKTDLDITLFKPYYRFNRQLPTDFTYNQHLLLAKCENEETMKFSKFWGNSEGQNDCFLCAIVEPGTYFLYAYVDIDSAKDINGNPLDNSLFSSLNVWLNVYSNEFFEFHPKGIDEKMSIFHRMIKSFNEDNLPQEENGLLIRADNNFFKSEFSYIYIKNIKGSDLDLKLEFSNAFLNPITHHEEIVNIPIKDHQEFISVFSCADIYEAHGFGYSYSYKKLKSVPKESLLPELISLSECPNDSTDITKYNWIYKRKDFDYSKIIKQIQASDIAFSHLKIYYPKEVELIEQVPKYDNHNDLKLEVQDKVSLGGEDWYIGEWKSINNEYVMYGRGLCYLQGIKFVGQFKDHNFTGIGERIEADGSKYKGRFEDFQPKGKVQYTHNDGKVEVLNMK